MFCCCKNGIYTKLCLMLTNLLLATAEADMVQLSHALKVLSQAEKQLRTSKNQGTWLIVALLQLSSTGSLHDGTSARLSTQTVHPRGQLEFLSIYYENI